MKKIIISICLITFTFFAFAQERGFKTKKKPESSVILKQKDKLPDRSLKPPKSDQTETNSEEGELDYNTLNFLIKTNKGNRDVKFKEGEIMNISFKVTQPCYLRLVYKLANGDLILLRDELKISDNEVGEWVNLPDRFECSAPFGNEELLAFASTNKFTSLNTELVGEYRIIKDELNTVAASSRGMTTVSKVVESRIEIITLK